MFPLRIFCTRGSVFCICTGFCLSPIPVRVESIGDVFEDFGGFEDGELISPMVAFVFTVLLFLLLPCAVLCIFAMLMYSSFKKVKLQKKVDKSELAGLGILHM